MKLTAVLRNTMLDSSITAFNSGILRLYDGTQPTNPDTALSGNTLLAELTLNATSAPAASAGVMTFNAVTDDASANASGTPTFARVFQSNGTTELIDLTVSGDITVSPSALTVGLAVSCSSFVLTFPVGS